MLGRLIILQPAFPSAVQIAQGLLELVDVAVQFLNVSVVLDHLHVGPNVRKRQRAQRA